MGKGTDIARAAGKPEHAQLIDDFKDQLLIVLVKRLQGAREELRVPVAEVDGTGDLVLHVAVRDGDFIFSARKKS